MFEKILVPLDGSARAEAILPTVESLALEFREKGVETETVLAQGSVVETIIQTAVEHDVELIAMASHGRTGLQRVFYGSVAAGVLQSVDRPLLLVRSRRL
ncbi:MAG: universal stress protein [Anaerolineales bacterium]